MRPLAVSALTGFVLLGAALAAPARADEQMVTQGSVTATFSFETDGEYAYDDLWLTISRGGQVLFDDAVSAGDCDESACILGGGTDRDSVMVRDLDGDGEPEIMLDVWRAGAHCCSYVRVFAFDGTAYRSREHGFYDAGYRIADLDEDGSPEFVSGDTRFAYRFTSFASSIFPIQIWIFDGTGFADVTDSFPERIRADAGRAWRLYRNRDRTYEPRGAIAAWAANRYRLGERQSALRTLRRLARAGRLQGYPPRRQAKFVVELDGFLRRLGY